MDDFSWATRVVIDSGNNKKVVVADNEKFYESMIPLKKLSENEQEAGETGRAISARIAVETRPNRATTRAAVTRTATTSRAHSRAPSGMSLNEASSSGDYHRDANLTYNSASNPKPRVPPSQRNTTMNPPRLDTKFGPGGFGSRPGSAVGHAPGSGGLLGWPAGWQRHEPAQREYAVHVSVRVGPPSAPGSEYVRVAPSAGPFAGLADSIRGEESQTSAEEYHKFT